MKPIGVLGAGQLGRMIALAGYPLGLRFRFYDPSADAPAGQLAPIVHASYDDHEALARFADEVALITYEFENVPVEAVRFLEARTPVFPGSAALEVAQDRLNEKRFFAEMGIPTAPYAAIESAAELIEALHHIGLPAVLKTRRFGYDGKGQRVVATLDEARAAFVALRGSPLIVEGFVQFERELSMIGVRTRGGETRFYPLIENQHHEGILRISIAPAPGVSAALEHKAEVYMATVLKTLDYVGVLAIEFFAMRDELIANEMAPRVHNSGHWTIEGTQTSQFENHVRAILGWPLGPTAARAHHAMLNMIGTIVPALPLLEFPEASLHIYGKAPRPGRKLGHVTVSAPDGARLAHSISDICRIMGTELSAGRTPSSKAAK